MQDIYTYARRIALAAFIFFLVAAAFYLFIQLTHFLLLVFAGILLAVLFTSLSEWVSAKTGFGRGLSLTIVTILLFGMLVGLGFIVAPTVGEQVNEMGDSIPQAWEDLKDKLRETTWGEQVLHEVENGTGKMIPESKAIFSRVTNMFTSTLSIFTDLLIVLITGLFLAANPLLYTKGFVKLFPVMRRNRVYEVLSLCYDTLRQWLWGMFLAMCLIGVTVWLGFTIIGLELALLMALLAFFLCFYSEHRAYHSGGATHPAGLAGQSADGAAGTPGLQYHSGYRRLCADASYLSENSGTASGAIAVLPGAAGHRAGWAGTFSGSTVAGSRHGDRAGSIHQGCPRTA
nr:AI-2E family transporter [Pontibacter sp. BAB1700]